ncbi:Hem4 uroporphyrinogen III synthase [Myxozyma melibiosi]|uniref:Hem4 uroporphyrinogen III synthase n=1 Tax=Myxozyma melibiosi TaxID=54550 RepID=A0ABR1FDT8_9ASCO
MSKRLVYLKNPSPDSSLDPYAGSAASRSYSSAFVPVLSHEFVDQDELKTYIQDMHSHAVSQPVNALIITSQRAVEAIASALDELTDDSTRTYILSLPTFTVGPATASLLESHGFTNILGGADAGNGSILATIICAQAEKFSRCVFFTGETHRLIIPKQLKAAGIECLEKIVYRSSDVAGSEGVLKELLAQGGSSEVWTVFFSPSGASKIAKTIAEIKATTNSSSSSSSSSSSIKVAAIGPTTEEFLLNNGITPDAVAKRPDPESLLNEIDKCT